MERGGREQWAMGPGSSTFRGSHLVVVGLASNVWPPSWEVFRVLPNGDWTGWIASVCYCVMVFYVILLIVVNADNSTFSSLKEFNMIYFTFCEQ